MTAPIEKLTPSELEEVPSTGQHPFVDLSRLFSPHHVSMRGDLLARDVRVRVGYGQHLPFWRGALRPNPRPARLAAGHSDRPVPF